MPAMVQDIDQAFFQRIFRAHIDQIHAIFQAKVGDLLKVFELYELNEAALSFRVCANPGLPGVK
jgi:hypothetical protein